MEEIESGKLRLTGTITSPILSDRLYITNLNSLCSVENVTVTDTAGQTNTAATQWVESDVNSGTWIFYDACQISKISFDLAYPDANGSYPIIVQVLTPSEENPGECYSRGLAGFSTGENWASAGNAGDYSLATSWHADTQYEGLEATVELSAPATISGFSLETGGKDWDCPQDLILSVSSDGEVWTEIDYQSDNNIDFLFSPVNCQYIRLTIGPHSEEVTSNWTVAEVLVYTDVKGIDNENN